jgi:hypothetical protein
MIIRKIGGRSASVAMPTTNLFAQYDANDTANHDTANGLWTPKAGSDTTDLKLQNSGGTADSITYGTNQNGLAVIDCPLGMDFRYETSSATTYDSITVVMAFRFNSGTYPFQVGSGLANSTLLVQRQGDNTLAVTTTASGGVDGYDVVQTGIAAHDGSFRIFGFGYSGGCVVPLLNGAATMSKEGNGTVDFDPAIKAAATSFGGWLQNSQDADVEIGEILIYDALLSTAEMADAVVYLANRWGLS